MQGVAGSSPVSPRNENTFFHWLEECVFSISGVENVRWILWKRDRLARKVFRRLGKNNEHACGHCL